MSWSTTLVGKPANIAAALDKYGETLNGVSKIEYEEVLPHLKGLLGSIKQNAGEAANPAALFKLSVSGHGMFDHSTTPPTKTSSTVNISLASEWVNLV